MKQISKPHLFFAIATIGVVTVVPAVSSGLNGAGNASRLAGALTAAAVGAPKTYVELQSSTPGTAQTGNINVTGAVKSGQVYASGAAISSASISVLNGVNATFSGTVASVNFTGQHGDLFGEFVGPAFNATNNGSQGGIGVQGYASAYTGSGIGVQGYANGDNGRGVSGFAGAVGDLANYGVYGQANGNSGYGVYGNGATGVKGVGKANVPQSAGVSGTSLQVGGVGVLATSGPNGPNFASVGLEALSNDPDGYAVFASGDALVLGSLFVSGSKNFMIDNPANPENEYLAHSCVESDEMKNIYDGMATFGPDGTAKVQLPTWFGALNENFRYQLTCVGGYAQVYVAEEIGNNAFTIAGGRPGMKVSWQVTGVRKDPSAKASGFNVVTPKAARDRGKFLDPAARHLGKEFGIQRPKNMTAPYRPNTQPVEPQ